MLILSLLNARPELTNVPAGGGTLDTTVQAEVNLSLCDQLGIDPDDLDLSCVLIDASTGVAVTGATVGTMVRVDSDGHTWIGSVQFPDDTASKTYFCKAYISDDIPRTAPLTEIDKDKVAPSFAPIHILAGS